MDKKTLMKKAKGCVWHKVPACPKCGSESVDAPGVHVYHGILSSYFVCTCGQPVRVDHDGV